MFQWKTLCEDNFLCFPMFDNIKKMSQMKTIFSQLKNILLIFRYFFPLNFFGKQFYLITS